MEPLFNKETFDEKKPFLKQVFKKQFDAFFFLDFPKLRDFDGINSHNLPCFFLNNIKQRNIFISNKNGTKNFHYLFKLNWQERNDFILAFNQELSEERFLFWQSEKQNWGMVSDSETEFAVIGIDWEIADQVKLFYEKFLISPNTAIEKLNLQDDKNSFIETYQLSENLKSGNEKNPIWEKYHFDCHIDDENDKLFYWKQFEPLFFSLSKVLKGFKAIDMLAQQTFWSSYYMNKQWYRTGKKAPVGGWQNYSHKNCQKVATKFLTENQHLVLQFEGRNEEADKLLRESKKGLIGFTNFEIYANVDKPERKGYPSDFHFRIIRFKGKNDDINQQFEIYFNKQKIKQEKIQELANELIQIGQARKVYRIERPYIFAKYDYSQSLEIYNMDNYRIKYNEVEVYL